MKTELFQPSAPLQRSKLFLGSHCYYIISVFISLNNCNKFDTFLSL